VSESLHPSAPVHAMSLRVQALRLPVKTLVMSGHSGLFERGLLPKSHS